MSDLWQNYGGLSKFVESVEDRVIGDACPDCGFDGDWSKASFVVGWENPEATNQEPATCPTCGRQTVIVIEWGEDEV